MIHKKRPTGNFTQISNDMFSDIRLNLTDRGLLATLLSLPPNWDYSVEGMTRILPDGKGKIQSSIKRLERLGYVTIIQDRNRGGRFWKNQLTINGNAGPPFTDNPATGNPEAGNPQMADWSAENRAQYKN